MGSVILPRGFRRAEFRPAEQGYLRESVDRSGANGARRSGEHSFTTTNRSTSPATSRRFGAASGCGAHRRPDHLCVLVLSLILPKTYQAERRSCSRSRAPRSRPPTPRPRPRSWRRSGSCSSRTTCSRRPPRKLDGETADTLHDKVDASVDGATSLVSIKAKDGDAAGAAAIANTVAATFVARRRAADRQRFAKARVDLEQALDRLRTAGASQDEITAVQDRLSELSVSEVSGNDDSGRRGRPAAGAAGVPPPAAEHPARPVRRALPRRARRGRSRLHGASRRRPAAVRGPDGSRAARRAPRHAPAPSPARRRRRPTRRWPPRYGWSCRSPGASCS